MRFEILVHVIVRWQQRRLQMNASECTIHEVKFKYPIPPQKIPTGRPPLINLRLVTKTLWNLYKIINIQDVLYYLTN